MIKKISFAAVAGLFVAIPFISQVGAQTTATMPTFYNQAGIAVNVGGGRVAPGFYYLSPGGAQIEYFGNGTFYNPSIKEYGGSISNPNGTAGVSLGYGSSSTPVVVRGTMAMMPTFYNQGGAAINTSGGRVAPGYYYLSVGGVQVEYYGNGTFYNPSIKQYGGSITNPNGTANVSLGYSI